MEFIIKLLKLKITKAIFSLIMIAVVLSMYYYKGWYIRQYRKCVAFYYVNKGDKAFKKHKYQKAIDNYKIGLKYYPGHSRAGCNLGNIYVSFENYHEAVNAYKNALKYAPNYSVCRMDLGIILAEKMADYDGAIEEYEKIINSTPLIITIPFIYSNKETEYTNKGRAYYNMGLAYKGKALYMEDKNSVSVRYLKKAKEAYLNAKKYLKDDYDNTYNLALTYHLLGDYYSAAEEYCEAINIEPENYDAHFNFALLLRNLNMNKDALDEIEKTYMLIDLKTDINKNKYVFDVINDIRRSILKDGQYDYLKDRTDLTSVPYEELNYSRGKVVFSKQKDFNMINMLKCSYNKKQKEMSE